MKILNQFWNKQTPEERDLAKISVMKGPFGISRMVTNPGIFSFFISTSERVEWSLLETQRLLALKSVHDIKTNLPKTNISCINCILRFLAHNRFFSPLSIAEARLKMATEETQKIEKLLQPSIKKRAFITGLCIGAYIGLARIIALNQERRNEDFEERFRESFEDFFRKQHDFHRKQPDIQSQGVSLPTVTQPADWAAANSPEEQTAVLAREIDLLQEQGVNLGSQKYQRLSYSVCDGFKAWLEPKLMNSAENPTLEEITQWCRDLIRNVRFSNTSSESKDPVSRFATTYCSIKELRKSGCLPEKENSDVSA